MVQPVEVAIAILYREQHFLCQLRDNNPQIVYPGCWGLFGGHLEPAETPAIAVKRELSEEIGYFPEFLSEFGQYADERAIRYVYAAPLTLEIEQLTLHEGWDLKLISPAEIRQGESYSVQARQVRPFGRVHQQILLDFLNSNPRKF